MTAALAFGLLFGLRHALEADHVAAVASLATGSRGVAETVRLGVLWGVGHAATLFAVGGAVLLAEGQVPERLAFGLEFCVGVMLLVLGGDVLRRMVRRRVHVHVHRHGGRLHLHAHAHPKHADHDAASHDHRHPPVGRALAVGLMHGLAGSAGLVVLVADGLSSPWLGVLTLGLFAVGSVAGMAVLSAAIALPLRRGARRLAWAATGLNGAVGVATVIIGAVILTRTAGPLFA